MGMEGWRMGTRGRGGGRRGCRDRRRDHRIPATGLRGVSQLRPAGVQTGLLLGIPAGVRRFRPRRGLYGAAGAGLPWLRPPPPPAPGYVGAPPPPPLLLRFRQNELAISRLFCVTRHGGERGLGLIGCRSCGPC